MIIAYLEKVQPLTKSVYPIRPDNFAQALWYEEYADTVMTDIFHKIFIEKVVKKLVLKLEANEKVVQECIDQIPTVLSYRENSLTENNTFLLGNTLTVGDIAILHHFVSLQIAKIELPLNSYPRLAKYLEQGPNHPSIQVAVAKI